MIRNELTLFEPRWARYAIVFASALILCGYWVNQFTGSPIENDAADNLRMAINLSHNGVISLESQPPYVPSMKREPVPVLSTALAVTVVDFFLGRAEPESYFSGDRARYLKYQNILWLILLCAAVFWSSFVLTSSFNFSLLAVMLINISLPLTRSGLWGLGLDTLYTELPAAAMLTLGALFLSVAITRERWRFLVASGLCFGVLALIKAAFLYVFLGLVSVLLCLSVLPRRFVPNPVRIARVCVVVAAFGAVVLPWTYRNYQELGSFQIALRGGGALYMRALYVELTAEEYLGSFYVWAPGRIRPLVGSMLGFSRADKKPGGRLHRFNLAIDWAAVVAGRPEETKSLWRRAQAEQVKLTKEFSAAGHTSPRIEANKTLQERATKLIRDNLMSHFAMTIPFLWWGAATTFPVLILGLGYALMRRRLDLFLFILPGFGMIMLYGLFTNFIPRYGVPALPVAIVSGVVLLAVVWEWARGKALLLLNRLQSTAVLSK